MFSKIRGNSAQLNVFIIVRNFHSHPYCVIRRTSPLSLEVTFFCPNEDYIKIVPELYTKARNPPFKPGFIIEDIYTLHSYPLSNYTYQADFFTKPAFFLPNSKSQPKEETKSGLRLSGGMGFQERAAQTGERTRVRDSGEQPQ